MPARGACVYVFVCANVRESQDADGESELVCDLACMDRRECHLGEKRHKEPRGEEMSEGSE